MASCGAAYAAFSSCCRCASAACSRAWRMACRLAVMQSSVSKLSEKASMMPPVVAKEGRRSAVARCCGQERYGGGQRA